MPAGKPFAAAALSLLALAVPAAGASAAAPPRGAMVLQTDPPMLTFVPPRVGPIVVDIAPTIIQGQEMSPGLQLATPGTSLPAVSFTPPTPPR